MDFNRYVFDCYRQTASAKASRQFFERLPILVRKGRWYEIQAYLSERGYTQEGGGYWTKNLDFARELSEDFADWQAAENIDCAVDDFEEFIDILLDEGDAKTHRNQLTWLEGISLFLYCKDPEHYLPYFFVERFFLLENLFHAFMIPLPELPGKQQYRERFLYYGQLCRSLYEFRIRHSLTNIDLLCFLYDFAVKTLPDFMKMDDLPEAVNVYISGGSQADMDALKAGGQHYQTFWQGNPQTKIGDIVLLYSLAPYSALTAVFRAVSPTYYDPFSYYPNRVWVGFPIIIPEIPLSELKNNPIWKEKAWSKPICRV